MDYRINYEPKNRITQPCEFLTEEKTIQYNENSRGKSVSLMRREHKCLKKNKIITVNNDCVECDFYINCRELIRQQAERIGELEEYINKINAENKKEYIYGCDGNKKGYIYGCNGNRWRSINDE